jgi:hypothetical protein
MNNLVTTNVKSSKTYRYYNTTVKILQGVAGAYMFVVGGALRFLAPGLVPALCGLLAAYAVHYAM